MHKKRPAYPVLQKRYMARGEGYIFPAVFGLRERAVDKIPLAKGISGYWWNVSAINVKCASHRYLQQQAQYHVACTHRKY